MAYLTTITNTRKRWADVDADVLALGIFEDKTLTEIGKSVDNKLGGQISKAVKGGDIKGESGESTLLFYDKGRVLIVGLGKRDKFNNETIRLAGGAVIKTAMSKKFSSVVMEVFGNESTPASCQALAEGIILGSYQFLNFKTDDEDQFEVSSATVLDADSKGLSKGVKIAIAVCLARDISNNPGNVSTPTYLAKIAGEIAKEGKMSLKVFDREEFTEMGMGGLAGVALGTDQPPKFIVVTYNGGSSSQKPVVLVGKGLTFDSGGISIKPAASMDEMKFDMCGSAVVLGILKAAALLKPKVNIVGIIPSTENLSGGKALKPGDILTAYNGKTIEVLNTDAEGRLILADGLSYASKHFDPEFILDFATLTGAVVIALGHVTTGILGTDPTLIEKIKAASERTGEKVWELPLWEEYSKHIKSKIADIKNVGEGRQAGTIAAGVFLKEFVKEGIPWVHFDIAGTAWGGKEKSYTSKKSATGAIIRLVLDLIKV
ncbi:MAG: leucyl aminopeptidase [Candidatus Neomarinimicrobiota bacterium]